MICAFSGAAEARPASEPFAPSGVPAEAPPGYVSMCHRNPEECADRPAVRSAGTLADADRYALIKSVNRRVNREVHWRADPVERWEQPTGERLEGDCEDFAIAKRADLIARGFPPEDLFYLVGYLPGTGLHAVLVAHTAEADYILDNRTNALKTWGEGPYVWILRQAAGKPSEWRNLLVRDVKLAAR
ncbi:hypothetical protein B2G71_05150 [Novosphingobium sp. PC22D]|nr:hypothetical protein B2G71_05150 [Novosphingobium sp. PC22D]